MPCHQGTMRTAYSGTLSRERERATAPAASTPAAAVVDDTICARHRNQHTRRVRTWSACAQGVHARGRHARVLELLARTVAADASTRPARSSAPNTTYPPASSCERDIR